MIAIDPERARDAAAHLRDRTRLVMDIDHDIVTAARVADLPCGLALLSCREIDEELTLLARILVARADEAAGFFLPGNRWQLPGALLDSLLDHHGHRATLSPPLAAHVLLDEGQHWSIDSGNAGPANPVFTAETLLAMRNHPSSSPQLRAAASLLLNNPTVIADTEAWQGTGAWLPSGAAGEIPLRDIEAFLERNEELRRALQPGGIVRADDLHTFISDDALRSAGIDPLRFDELALPRNGHDLLVAGIEHGTFNHSAALAQQFVHTLPVHRHHNQSIDITAIGSPAIQLLYDAATDDLSANADDFIVRSSVIAHLPESSGGVRNALITSIYADIAKREDTLLNGRTPATSPRYRGTNWFHMGTAASDTVGDVIEGEERVLAVFSIPPAVRQEVADGNQAIFTHFMDAYARRLQGEPSGSARLDRAFALLDEAARTADIRSAQYLVAESSALMAVDEQLVVDPYVQLEGAGLIERLGTRFVTLLAGDQRSVGEVMTDEGVLRFDHKADVFRPDVAIGEPIPLPLQSNNLINRDELRDRLPADIDWHRGDPNQWPEFEERMPVIADVAVLVLTDPALSELVDEHAGGNLQ